MTTKQVARASLKSILILSFSTAFQLKVPCLVAIALIVVLFPVIDGIVDRLQPEK